jgi:hypothetical protein
MKAQTLRALLDGRYICPVAFKREYEFLIESGNEQVADKWLGEIDMRLARLGTDGAFFMAQKILSAADTARIRDDFQRYRDVYGPAHRMMQIIRSSKDEFTLTPGEYIQLAELNQAINESPTLESQLRGLQTVIHDGGAKYTNRELLKRLLDHLRNDGYLVLVNVNTEMYQTTGKVDQIKSVLTFLAENTDIVGSVAEEDTAADVSLFDAEEPIGD